MSKKLCVIVGVGPGLGLAIARKFGQEGYQLAIVARRAEAIAQYTKTLEALPAKVSSFSADASDPPSLERAFEQIRQTLGHPNVLVYNAAVLRQDNLVALTPDELLQDFKVNVAGALTAVQQVLPNMEEQEQGTILLTGGGLALYPSPQFISLGIGKTSIRYLALSLAEALEAKGIHLATVTICGSIEQGTRFDPDAIAQVYWKLHTQERGAWEQEYVYQ